MKKLNLVEPRIMKDVEAALVDEGGSVALRRGETSGTSDRRRIDEAPIEASDQRRSCSSLITKV